MGSCRKANRHVALLGDSFRQPCLCSKQGMSNRCDCFSLNMSLATLVGHTTTSQSASYELNPSIVQNIGGKQKRARTMSASAMNCSTIISCACSYGSIASKQLNVYARNTS